VRKRLNQVSGISIGSAVFAGLTRQTDRPTDRQTRLLGRFDCDLGMAQVITKWMGSRSPMRRRNFFGKASPIVKYGDFLPWAVQKRLNQSICYLGCGLG